MRSVFHHAPVAVPPRAPAPRLAEGITAGEIKPILLLIDIEPDEFFVNPRGERRLSGFENALPFLEQQRRRLQDAKGRPVQFSWSIRADEQIAVAYGNANWILSRYGDIIAKLRADGDAVGLHVHAYRQTATEHYWIEDYGSQAWVNHCIEVGFNTFRAQVGESPTTFSTGADWTSSETLKYVSALGVRVDYSVVSETPSVPFHSADLYTGSRIDATTVRLRAYRPSNSDLLVADPDPNGSFWVLPQTRTRLHRPPDLWTRLLHPHALKPDSGCQVLKMYLHAPAKELRWQMRALCSQRAPPYLTLAVATRSFAYPERLAAIERNLAIIRSHQLISQFALVTALQYIEAVERSSAGLG